MNRNCTSCGKPVIEVDGTLVHEGAGRVEQKCMSCGWTGGQFGKFTACPRCGDATALKDMHSAS